MSESVQVLPGTVEERPGRVVALDVLRGIAIVGTLGTNVWIFTNPAGLVGYAQDLGGAAENGWMWTERVLQQLAQGKFLGLLTVMFGIGLAIQQASAHRGGRRWPGRYPVRAGLLFLDGLLNFLLIAEFDVLMGYAVTGLVVAYLLATSERAQRRWLITAAAIHLTMMTLIAAALAFAPAQERSSAPLDPNPYADGSFWDLVLFRLDHVLTFRLETILVFPMSVALFLLGARLYHAGVFRPEGARLRRRLMVLGFGIAAPLDLVIGVFGGGDLVLLTRYGIAPFVALGILAAVAEFYQRGQRTGLLGARLGEVGRMALSCYILQNLIAGILCYGWGFGLATRIPAAALVPFTIGVFALVVALIALFAHLWLRWFERGPVEWLWQRTYRLLARTD
ncbi:DUF418 domain-containing protein [Nocardia rhizosphaerae]|uniref:DUF418 domain-containing protein n=1 Tax=Nocardia rhizosphaerae TaxID=1691571 RepID=A0ABV8LE75_9NOCA